MAATKKSEIDLLLHPCFSRSTDAVYTTRVPRILSHLESTLCKQSSAYLFPSLARSLLANPLPRTVFSHIEREQRIRRQALILPHVQSLTSRENRVHRTSPRNFPAAKALENAVFPRIFCQERPQERTRKTSGLTASLGHFQRLFVPWATSLL